MTCKQTGTHARPPLPRTKYQLFPGLAPGAREALRESIARHGVETPTTWDEAGNLLDGWEREALCAQSGTTCPREVRQFAGEPEKFAFVLAVNAHRRPALTRAQKRAVIAAYLRGDPEVADATLGAALGASKNTVLRVRRELEASCQIPTVETTRGRDGKGRPVRYAKRIITNSPREFEKALEYVKDLPDRCAGKTVDVATAKRRAATNRSRAEREGPTVVPCADGDIRLFPCRFQDLEQRAGIAPASAALVLTDIPYGKDFLGQLPDLAEFARRVLVEGGLLVTYSGQYYLDAVLAALGGPLRYRWLSSTVFAGGVPNHQRNVVSRWKPVLIFSKGGWRKRGRWSDVLRGRREKDWHVWQQSLEEAEQLVRYFSSPGDQVIDPCGGGFTVAEACLRQGRRCVSCDVDEACWRRGLERLAAAREALGRPAEGCP